MVREDLAHETKLRRKTSRGKSAIAWAAGKAPSAVETVVDCRERDSQPVQPATQPEKRRGIRKEIEELYQTNTWAALALAFKHNVGFSLASCSTYLGRARRRYRQTL